VRVCPVADNRGNIEAVRFGVTGGTGVLGRRLAQRLTQEGRSVTCLVRDASKAEDLARLGVKLIHGDLTDRRSLSEFVQSIDVCLHLAAHVGYGTREQYTRINVDGTSNLCRAILEHRPDVRLVHCSTINSLKVTKWCHLASTPYAASKYYADKLVEGHTKNDGLKSVIVYPGLIYGPGDTNMLPNVIENIAKGRLFLVNGGQRNAPLIYIDDLCELLLLAATKRHALGKKYVAINKSSEGIHDFFRKIASREGLRAPRVVLPKLPLLVTAICVEGLYRALHMRSHPPLSRRVVDVLSINAAHKNLRTENDLGWAPKTNMDAGCKFAIEWYHSFKREVSE
jgi:2-alkyl-3-oxoalkanoate reductase